MIDSGVRTVLAESSRLDAVLPPLRSLLERSAPVTERAIEAILISRGIAGSSRFSLQVYRTWLEEISSFAIGKPRAPWTSVEGMIDAGRKQLLDALRDHEDEVIACSRLQIARDVGIASGSFLASGAALAVPVVGGFSRAQVLRHGWRQLLTKPALLLRMLRSRWRLDLHTNDRLLGAFNQAAWELLYSTVSSVLEREPTIDAVVATAWYLDGEVARFSPHLGYLRKIPSPRRRHIFIDLPAAAADIEFALKRSTARRRAHAEGHYVPRTTFLYWPR